MPADREPVGILLALVFSIGLVAGCITGWLMGTQVGLARRQTFEVCLQHHSVQECAALKP